jgi:hypothetical protein
MWKEKVSSLKNICSHAAVLIGAVCAAIEIYEGVKLKNR